MVPNLGDEFAFLEFNDLDIDFSAFEGNTTSGENAQQDDRALKAVYGEPAYYGNSASIRNDGSLPKSSSAADINMLKGQISGLQVQPSSHPHGEVQAYGAQQPLHYQAQGRIPPTPTSIDIRGNRQQFNMVDPQQQAMFEAHMRKQQDQVRS